MHRALCSHGAHPFCGQTDGHDRQADTKFGGLDTVGFHVWGSLYGEVHYMIDDGNRNLSNIP